MGRTVITNLPKYLFSNKGRRFSSDKLTADIRRSLASLYTPVAEVSFAMPQLYNRTREELRKVGIRYPHHVLWLIAGIRLMDACYGKDSYSFSEVKSFLMASDNDFFRALKGAKEVGVLKTGGQRIEKTAFFDPAARAYERAVIKVASELADLSVNIKIKHQSYLI